MIAECPEGEGVITAEIDLKYLEKVRTQMPVQQHQRHDLYGDISVQNKGKLPMPSMPPEISRKSQNLSACTATSKT